MAAVSKEIKMDRAVAEKVHTLVKDMFARANDVLYITNNSGDAELRKKTQRAIGVVIAELGLEILEPIYKQFPDLPPPGVE